MKLKKILYLLLITVSLTFSFAPELFSNNKKSVAVLDFTSNNIENSYGKVVRNRIELMLYNTGKFNMLERNMIQLKSEEQLGDEENCDKISCAVNIGKSVSADYVVFGSIDVAKNYIITVRIVDVSLEKIVIADSEECTSEDQIFSTSALLGTRTGNSIDNFTPEKDSEKISESPGQHDQYQNKSYYYQNKAYKASSPVHLHLSLLTGAAMPMGNLETIAKTGFNLSASVGAENSEYNYILAFETGYSYFNGKSDATYYSMIPLMFNFQYILNITEIVELSPSLSLGGAYNTSHDSISESSAFEPIIKAGVNLNISAGSYVRIMSGMNLYNIFEKNGGIQVFSFNFGIGLCI